MIDFDPLTTFGTPEHCIDCPALCGIGIEIIQHQVAQEAQQVFADEVVMGGVLNGVITPDIAKIIGLPEEEVAQAMERATKKFGQEIAANLDAVDEETAELKMKAKALIDNCLGSLTMQAYTKLGRNVEVTVCGSNLAPIDDREEEHTHVLREDF